MDFAYHFTYRGKPFCKVIGSDGGGVFQIHPVSQSVFQSPCMVGAWRIPSRRLEEGRAKGQVTSQGQCGKWVFAAFYGLGTFVGWGP